jgi:hypothetical protein
VRKRRRAARQEFREPWGSCVGLGNQTHETLFLDETIEFLRQCHRRAPFLFFNGNTFADVGRALADLLFADLPTGRRREVMSAVAH